MIQRSALKPVLRDALGDWEHIQHHFDSSERIFVIAEFDGVLTSCGDPSHIRIDPDVRIALQRLSTLAGVTVVLMSSRPVYDLRSSVNLPLVFVGDQGTEIYGPDVQYSAPEADRVRAELPALCNCIKSAVSRIPGAFVEPRRLGATVYSRTVNPYLVERIVSSVNSCVRPELYQVTAGNCVVDVRARLQWTKADAVRWILQHYNVKSRDVICLGGDESDSELFRTLPDALNVQIGFEGHGLGAPNWLPQPDVAQFLLRVAQFASDRLTTPTQGRALAFSAF